MKKNINRRTALVAVSALGLSFAAGRLVAQPNIVKPQGAAPIDPEKEAFMADLAAAVKMNHHAKVLGLMEQAAGNAKLTNALVHKTWDMAYNVSVGKADTVTDRRDVLQATFVMKQQQKQIELLEQILVEMKKSNASKAK